MWGMFRISTGLFLCSCSLALRIIDSQFSIIPILHNLQPVDADYVFSGILQNLLKTVSISLRHESAMDSLKSFANLREILQQNISLGVSTVVSEKQISDAKSFGAAFISTPVMIPSLIELAKRKEMYVISAATSLKDVEQAISLGADAIKIYPIKEVSERELDAIFLRIKGFDNHYPIITAGGLTIADANERYLKQFDGMAIGVDCTSAQKGVLKKLNDISSFLIL